MLCISRMSDPWTISSPLDQRSVISRPDQPWEKTPYNRTINDRLSSNEGPEQLTNPTTGQQFIIYSAARSDNRDYCLGQLELVGDDPMDPASWSKHTAGCVFSQDPGRRGVWRGPRQFHHLARRRRGLDRLSRHEGLYGWLGCPDDSRPELHLERGWLAELPTPGCRSVRGSQWEWKWTGRYEHRWKRNHYNNSAFTYPGRDSDLGFLVLRLPWMADFMDVKRLSMSSWKNICDWGSSTRSGQFAKT